MKLFKIILMSIASLSFFNVNAQLFGKMVDAPVTSGEAGNYIFCFDNKATINNIPPNYYATADYCSILRSDDGTSFREIAKIRPAQTENELNEIFESKTFINDMMKNDNTLKSPAEVIALFQAPSRKYGVLLLEPIKLMKAMGLVYLDKNVKKGKKYFYRVEVIGKERSKKIVINGEVIAGKNNPLLAPYKFKHKPSSILAIDSAVSVRWQMVHAPNTTVYKYNVYASTNHDPNFQIIDTGRSAYQRDTLNIGIVKKSRPGVVWKMFCKPIDYLGNEGVASDTVTIVSFGSSSIPFIEDFTSKDTTGGIWLTWKKLPQEDYLSGILLTRSLGTEDTFVIIDTLTLASNTYLDRSALNGTLYNYEIQPLLAPINKISMDEVIPVRQTGIHRSREKTLPSNVLRVKQVGKNIILNWDKSDNPDLNSYVVYGSTDINFLTQIGGFLTDTTFVDSTSNGDFEHQTRYYAVGTYTNNGQFSLKSKVVSIQPKLAINLNPPTQILVRQNNEDLIIDWDDARPNDSRIEGYKVFRRTNNEAYKLMNNEILHKNQYIDSTSKSNGKYEYVVVSVSTMGSESPGSLSNWINFEKKLLSTPPPMAEIFVRNIPPGIEISWAKFIQNDIIGFNIFRKNEIDSEFTKLTSLRANQNSYWDKSVNTGEKYLYIVTYVLKNGQESDKSEVKLIERVLIDNNN